MTLNPDLVGTRSAPVEFSWTADDVLLYAVAVGAGQEPTAELALTTENTDGVTPLVLPTFANIITRGARIEFGDYDRARLVHAEQSFRLPAPLPLTGRATVTAEVTGVLDQGRGVLITTEAGALDAATGAVLATTVHIAGEGGVGSRGATVASRVPDRTPDEVVAVTTRPEQALLYRLTGDRNPLHTDPAFAARGGFATPILHGMCTYGFTGRVLLQTVCGGDVGRFAGMDARFTRPVLPGDALAVSIWHDPAGAYFRTTRDGEPVLDRGRLDLHPEPRPDPKE